MVRIINGEIVQDDDPRLKARYQQPQQHPPQRHGDGGGGTRGLSGFGGGAPRGMSQQGSRGSTPPPGHEVSPLQNLAKTLGLEGTVLIPEIKPLKLPAKPVQKIHLALSFLLVLFLGWRALLFLAFVYYMSLQPAAGTVPQPHQ
jgi:hypothetical protein